MLKREGPPGYSQTLRCPRCNGSHSKVIDARPVVTKNCFRRRRMCLCGHRYTTHEKVVDEEPIDYQI